MLHGLIITLWIFSFYFERDGKSCAVLCTEMTSCDLYFHAIILTAVMRINDREKSRSSHTSLEGNALIEVKYDSLE